MSRNLAVGRAPAVGRRRILSPLDPRDVPGLMAGGIWLPGVGVSTLPGGYKEWRSQSSNTGASYDLRSTLSGYHPVATTASNGAAVWDLDAAGPTACFNIASGITLLPPGPALQFTQRGSMAGWFRAKSVTTAIWYFYSMWPGGSSGNRAVIYKNDDPHRIAVFTSYAGSAVDAPPETIGQRCKWNSGSGPGLGPLTDWTLWHFVRFTWDMSGTNLQILGGNYSTMLRVYIDEEEVANDVVSGAGSYSAPDSAHGGAPPDGPMRGIWNGATRLSVGSDGESSHIPGQLGPQFISNEDATDPITDEQWPRVMLYNAPA